MCFLIFLLHGLQRQDYRTFWKDRIDCVRLWRSMNGNMESVGIPDQYTIRGLESYVLFTSKELARQRDLYTYHVLFEQDCDRILPIVEGWSVVALERAQSWAAQDAKDAISFASQTDATAMDVQSSSVNKCIFNGEVRCMTPPRSPNSVIPDDLDESGTGGNNKGGRDNCFGIKEMNQLLIQRMMEEEEQNISSSTSSGNESQSSPKKQRFSQASDSHSSERRNSFSASASSQNTLPPLSRSLLSNEQRRHSLIQQRRNSMQLARQQQQEQVEQHQRRNSMCSARQQLQEQVEQQRRRNTICSARQQEQVEQHQKCNSISSDYDRHMKFCNQFLSSHEQVAAHHGNNCTSTPNSFQATGHRDSLALGMHHGAPRQRPLNSMHRGDVYRETLDALEQEYLQTCEQDNNRQQQQHPMDDIGMCRRDSLSAYGHLHQSHRRRHTNNQGPPSLTSWSDNERRDSLSMFRHEATNGNIVSRDINSYEAQLREELLRRRMEASYSDSVTGMSRLRRDSLGRHFL